MPLDPFVTGIDAELGGGSRSGRPAGARSGASRLLVFVVAVGMFAVAALLALLTLRIQDLGRSVDNLSDRLEPLRQGARPSRERVEPVEHPAPPAPVPEESSGLALEADLVLLRQRVAALESRPAPAGGAGEAVAARVDPADETFKNAVKAVLYEMETQQILENDSLISEQQVEGLTELLHLNSGQVTKLQQILGLKMDALKDLHVRRTAMGPEEYQERTLAIEREADDQIRGMLYADQVDTYNRIYAVDETGRIEAASSMSGGTPGVERR